MIMINVWMLFYCGATLAEFEFLKGEIGSNLNRLYLVINLKVERVIITNKCIFDKGLFWRLKAWISLSDSWFDLCPLIVVSLSFIFRLGDAECPQCIRFHFQSRLKSLLVDFFQNSFKGNQRLLQDFVPMVLSKFNDDWYEDWEGLFLVSLENVEEVVILEEAHSTVSYL